MQKIETVPKNAASKTNKRKSKKSTDVIDADAKVDKDEPIPPEPTSYAEAAKEDPILAEKRLAEKTKQEHTKNETQDTAQSSEKGSEKETTDPTPAGDMTFAQAVKDGSADGNGNFRSEQPPKHGSADEKKTSQSTSDISQSSTTVDYPEIQSDEEDEEEEQRRRDKEKAAVVGGARWAPLGVPVKRRLQTAAVLMHCVGIGLSLSIFFSFCAVPIFWPISTFCWNPYPLGLWC